MLGRVMLQARQALVLLLFFTGIGPSASAACWSRASACTIPDWDRLGTRSNHTGPLPSAFALRRLHGVLGVLTSAHFRPPHQLTGIGPSASSACWLRATHARSHAHAQQTHA